MERREPQGVVAAVEVDREAAVEVAVNLSPADPVEAVDSTAVVQAVPQDSQLVAQRGPLELSGPLAPVQLEHSRQLTQETYKCGNLFKSETGNRISIQLLNRICGSHSLILT